jgi:iron complex outermembrane recepter protein
MKQRWWLAALFAAVLVVPSALEAQSDRGEIAGRVVTSAGDAVPDAQVTLTDLKRRARVDESGRFRFADVVAGSYLLVAQSPGFGKGSARAELAAGGSAEVEITIDVERIQDEIVVSAGGIPRQQLELAQPTTVLTGEELDQQRGQTLGETLASQPGMASTYFGPGASRPVIRGLGGDRVRMLTDGLGSADASNVSPDHAVSLEPLTTERIEVLRGPSTLLYGSTAVGGVVNILDGSVPEILPDRPFSGTVDLSANSVAEETSGALALSGGIGRFAWHADFGKRESEDYDIPGFANLEPDDEDEEGTVPNSFTETESGSVGFSWIGEGALVGFGYSKFDTLYGIPGEGEGEEEEAVDAFAKGGGESVSIDLEQERLDLKLEVFQPFGPFRGAKLRLGANDYVHQELEGEEIGTTFKNEGLEGRFELVQKQRGPWSGSIGAQYADSDLEAIGEEAFVPPTTTRTSAVFAFQEVELGASERFRLQFGGRYETADLAPEGEGEGEPLPDRDFDGVSGSLGLVWVPVDGYSVSLSAARSDRLPTATELYANGPHVATRAFELGDPDLEKEKSLGFDLSLAKTAGRFTGTLNFFLNRFDGYIFEQFTDEVEDGLPVLLFAQQDAEFKGLELRTLLELFRVGDGHLDLSLGYDEVRAELTDTDEWVPRIPARRFLGGLTYHQQRLRAYVEAVRTEDQDRVARNETPTAGSTVLNAGVSYRLFLGNQVLDLLARGRNLTDEEVRNHVSFLKDQVPLPGRDFSLSLRFSF